MNTMIPFFHTIRHQLVTAKPQTLKFFNATVDPKSGEVLYPSLWTHGDLPLVAKWLKDDKMVLLYAEKSLADFGISVDISRSGIIKTSKRLSRLLRPSRFFTTYEGEARPRVLVDPNLDNALWDGMCLIRRSYVVDIARRSPWMLALRDEDPKRHALLFKEMLAIERLEITLVDEHGQVKGHATVKDDDTFCPTADVLISADAYKREVCLTNGTTFLSLEPVHGKDSAVTDIQSLVNLWPFVGPFIRPALDMSRAATRKMLDDLYRGQYRFPEISDSELSDEIYPLMIAGRYGIDPLAYPAVMNMVAKSRLDQLDKMRRELAIHLPNLSRRYLAVNHYQGPWKIWRSDDVSLFVPHVQYEQIAGVLGGADLDDGLLVLPFLDYDGQGRTLIWRQPNQTGEWWLLEGTPEKLEAPLVTADSRLLFTRIDKQSDRPKDVPPSVPPMTWDDAVVRVLANKGAIGTFANYMMLVVSVTGELPQLPCSFESIIDASVKDGRDVSRELDMIRGWKDAEGRKIAGWMELFYKSHAIPHVMLPRIAEWDRDEQRLLEVHWLDVLVERLTEQYDALNAERLTFRNQATLPITGLLEAGSDGDNEYEWFFAQADQFKRLVVNSDGDSGYAPDWPVIGRLFADRLREKPLEKRDAILLRILGLAAAKGISDLPCFMAQTAAFTFDALERHGLNAGTSPSTHVYVQHVWFNLARALGVRAERMADIPKDQRDGWKAKVRHIDLDEQEIAIAGREVYSVRTGLLMGLLPKYDEGRLADGRYRVIVTWPDDAEGSLHLRLSLVSSF